MTNGIAFLKVEDIIVMNSRKCNHIFHDSEYDNVYNSFMKHQKQYLYIRRKVFYSWLLHVNLYFLNICLIVFFFSVAKV